LKLSRAGQTARAALLVGVVDRGQRPRARNSRRATTGYGVRVTDGDGTGDGSRAVGERQGNENGRSGG